MKALAVTTVNFRHIPSRYKERNSEDFFLDVTPCSLTAKYRILSRNLLLPT
jgi:hypothetical protein